MQWTQAAIREMPIRYRERHFLKKGGQTPEQFVQRSCGSSIPGNTQNSAGSNPEHNLTSKLVLLSDRGWSRWPPEVSSYLNYSNSDLCLPETKNPSDIVHYQYSHSNIHRVKGFPSQIFYWLVSAIIKYKAGAHSRTIPRKHSWFSKPVSKQKLQTQVVTELKKQNKKPNPNKTHSWPNLGTSRKLAEIEHVAPVFSQKDGICCRYWSHQTNSTLVLSQNFRSRPTPPVALQPPHVPLSSELIYGAFSLLFEALQILISPRF